MRLETFETSYFCSKNHFEDDNTQSYLVSQSVYRYYKAVVSTNKVTVGKSKQLPDDSIKPPSTFDNSLNSGMKYIDNAKIQVKFDVKKEKTTFTGKHLHCL